MECQCLTGGLHVDGTCLVCYRPAPERDDEPTTVVAVDFSDDVVPSLRRVATDVL